MNNKVYNEDDSRWLFERLIKARDFEELEFERWEGIELGRCELCKFM